MPDKFTLNINLDNASMQAPNDVAHALRPLIEQLASGFWHNMEGVITDVNGNTVGKWEVT